MGRAYAGDLVSVGVYLGHLHGVLTALVLHGRLPRDDALVEHRAVVLHVQTVCLVGVFHALYGREPRPGDVSGNGRLVAAGGNTALGRRHAGRCPVIQAVQQRSQQRRGVKRVGRVPVVALPRAAQRVGVVLRTREEEHPRAVVVRQVAAERISVYQRAPPVPVLGRGLRVDDQWVGIGPLQNAVDLAGERVGGDRVGERELVGRVEAVVVLAREAARLREAVVEHDATAAGDVRRDCVAHAPPRRVLVESAVHELPQESSALRSPPAVHPLDAVPATPERVGSAV